MNSHIKGKNVLFISTKGTDYIRNEQESDIIALNSATYRGISSNASNYAMRLLSVYARLLFTDFSKYDTVFIGFAPQLIIPFFKRRLKRSGAYIMIDFFISSFDTFCEDRKTFKPDSVTGRLLHRLDEYTLSNADYVISDTNIHGRFFESEFNVDHSKLFTLYLQANNKIYHPQVIERPGNLIGKLIVLYFGTNLPLQGTDIVLDAYKKLAGYNSIRTIFIGHLHDKQQELVASIPNLIYIDWMSQSDLAMYINYADLCLAGHFSSTIEKARRTIPGKAYIYDAIKKPMILGDTPANHELFDGNNTNYIYIPLGDSQALATSILRFFGL